MINDLCPSQAWLDRSTLKTITERDTPQTEREREEPIFVEHLPCPHTMQLEGVWTWFAPSSVTTLPGCTEKGWALCDKSQQRAEVHKTTRAYPRSERRLSISSSNIPLFSQRLHQGNSLAVKENPSQCKKRGGGKKRETFPSVILKERSNGIELRCIEELYCSHTSLSGFPIPSLLPFLLPLQASQPSSKSPQHQAEREGDKHAQRGCFVSPWTSNH